MSYYFNYQNTRGYTDSQLKEMNEKFDKIYERLAEDPEADLKEAEEKFLTDYDNELAQRRYRIVDIRGDIDLGFETFETMTEAEAFLEDLSLLDDLEAPKNDDLKFYAIKTINIEE